MNLKPYNTFGIDALCDSFLPITHIADLQSFLTNYNNNQTKLPLHILGGGSNVLLYNPYLPGTVLYNQLKGMRIEKENSEHVWLHVASGEIWHDLVLFALKNNWGGIENLSLIPGTVGAAPVQNIGAYGVELNEVLEYVEVIDLSNSNTSKLNNEDCAFNYRDSIFKHQAKGKYFISAICLRLDKKHTLKFQYGDIKDTLKAMNVQQPSIQLISQAVCSIRQNKLPNPKQLGNAGSFFKNPEIQQSKLQQIRKQKPELPAFPLPNWRAKIPAAWLIEQCGWKGKRIGDAGVHAQHALVLVNYGTAKGAEIWQLAQQIQDSVKQEFDIELCPEVNVWY